MVLTVGGPEGPILSGLETVELENSRAFRPSHTSALQRFHNRVEIFFVPTMTAFPT
jgi:hypothetical protein